MKSLQSQAMHTEVKEWWSNCIDHYQPKDSKDKRLDCVAELMFLFSTQYLIVNGYTESELFNDLATQFKLYKDSN